MKKNGSPLPRFETDDDRSFFLIRFPVHKRAGSENGEKLGRSKAQAEAQEAQEPIRSTPPASWWELSSGRLVWESTNW